MERDYFKIGDEMSMKLDKAPFGDSLKFEGKLHLQLFDENGNLKQEEFVHNTVKDYGLYGVMEWLLASPSSPGKPTHMEVGTGTGGTTKLNAYLAGRTAFSSKTRSNAVLTMVCTFGAGVSTGAITEAGVFDSGTEDAVGMYLYSTFSVINKAAGDSLTITWTFTAATS